MATSYEKVRARKLEVLVDLEDLLRERDENAEREFNAVNKLQAFRRAIVARRWLRKCHRNAIEMQRFYRGHMGRTLARQRFKDRRNAERMAFFHFQAIALQRTFRGFYSRRYVHDFFTRKKYIDSVLEQSRRLRGQLNEHRQKQEDAIRKKESEDMRVEFQEMTENLHHLLSTQSQPGIYKPTFLDETPPTAFNKPVEAHIKTQFKTYIRKEGGVEEIGGRKMRECLMRPVSRRAVQAETRYGVEIEKRKQERRFEKLKEISPRAWSATGKLRHIHAPGINSGEQYTELWRIARSVRESVDKSVKQPFYTSVRHSNNFEKYALEHSQRMRKTLLSRGENEVSPEYSADLGEWGVDHETSSRRMQEAGTGEYSRG